MKGGKMEGEERRKGEEGGSEGKEREERSRKRDEEGEIKGVTSHLTMDM